MISALSLGCVSAGKADGVAFSRLYYLTAMLAK